MRVAPSSGEEQVAEKTPYDNRIPAESPAITSTHWFPIYVAIVTAVLITMMLASVAIGSVPLPLNSVLRALIGRVAPWQSHPAGAAIAPAFTIVWLLRMPRTIMAALVGAALGVAGAQMQGLFQNPLASPDIIGVSAGGVWAA
jgi:iron complex transport system permease protein